MKFMVWVRPWMIEDAEETIEVDAGTKEEAEHKASKWGYVMMTREKNSIRYIIGDMPFDRDGVHATGREVLRESPAGTLVWYPEYEDDDTWDDPVTESDEEYDKRYSEELERQWEETA